MNDQQLEVLKKENIIKVDRVERLPVDPPLAGQEWGLFSFKLLPRPVNGVYGFLKFRGAFATEDEYIKHATHLIQGVDSKHKLWPYRQGHWFPITTNEEFVKEEYEVSQQDKLSDIYKQRETQEQRETKQKMRDIQDRQKALQEESKRGTPDTESLRYYAHKTMEIEQINSWLENLRKRKRDLLNALLKNRDEIERLNKEHPEYQEQVMEEIKVIKSDIGLEEDAPIDRPSVSTEGQNTATYKELKK